jgi:hypothetical protein
MAKVKNKAVVGFVIPSLPPVVFMGGHHSPSLFKVKISACPAVPRFAVREAGEGLPVKYVYCENCFS